MTADVVQFPPVLHRGCASAHAVTAGISEIMMLIAKVTIELDQHQLPEALHTKLVLQMQRLAIQACSINLTVADHVAVPDDFSARIEGIIAKLAAAKPLR